MRFVTPANVLLRRAQLTLMLVVLVPTVLSTAVGIVLLAVGTGRGILPLVAGVLVLSFAATAITGYILGSIFVAKGASQARAQSDFLSLVSHELRTPLTSIGLFLASLRDERMTDEAEKHRCLELLDQEVRRLSTLVETLMALSRLETGRYVMEVQQVNVTALVDEAIVQLNAAALPETPPVDIDCDPDLTVLADRHTLSRAIGNLLINAWKYADTPGAEITVRGFSENSSVVIEVADQGPGIPRTEHKRIFEKFERGERAIDSGVVGSGLGLAIVKATVDAHHGQIELHSRPGRGATFRMTLPSEKAA